jgi:hypothetical protein
MSCYIQRGEEWVKSNGLPTIILDDVSKFWIVLKRQASTKPEVVSVHSHRVGAWIGLVKTVLRVP